MEFPPDQVVISDGGLATELERRGHDLSGSLWSARLLADQLERLHVERARGLGWSWQDIATVLGVSKQAVHKKHGRR